MKCVNISFFSKELIYAKIESKTQENREQYPTKNIFDLNRGNVKVKFQLKQN